MPSATSRATAGATIARSSSPRVPASPACGLSPATASRGCAIPKRVARSRATIRPVSTTSSLESCLEDFAQRQVDCHRHDSEFRGPQHHHRAQRLAGRFLHQLGEKFSVAGLGKSPIVEHVLGDRIGDDGRCRPRHDVGDRAADRSDGGRRAGSIRPAGLGADTRRRAVRPGAPRETSAAADIGVTVAIGTSRPSRSARRARKFGSATI